MVKEKVVKNGNLYFIEWLLPFYMFWAQYSFNSISLGNVFLMVVSFLFILKSGNVEFPVKFWPYYLFLIYIIACDLFRFTIGFDSNFSELNRILAYLVTFFCVFIVGGQPFDENRLYRNWKIAGVFFAAGLIYHVVQIYVLKNPVHPISVIPGYELLIEEKENMLRPTSFFSEPASFVGSMLPLLFLSLKKQEYRWAVFVTLVILLSTSSVGVVLSAILWGWSINTGKKTVGNKVLLFFLLVILVLIFFNSSFFSYSQTKFMAVTTGESTFDSRVLGGLEFVSRMPFSDLIFGANYCNPLTYIGDNLVYFENSELLMHYYKFRFIYLNTFSRLLFLYGIVGLFLFLVPFIRYLRMPNYAVKGFVVVVLASIFGQSLTLNAHYFCLIMFFILHDNYADSKAKKFFNGEK